MLYLSGCIPAKQHLRQLLLDNNVGVMTTPYSFRYALPEWNWAADNGCFSNKWAANTWMSWLESQSNPETALFATIPDVVADHCGTLERWHQWSWRVQNLGYKTAFVLQDGAHSNKMPWDEMDALFIGGTTEYKLSSEARFIIERAKELGKWVHMGRVNSIRRIKLAYEWGCDSVDGTYIAFGPDVNTPKLVGMLNRVLPQLKLFV
jgi:hypothetical protein